MQILQNIAIEKRKNCGTQCVKILAKLQQLSGWLNYDNLVFMQKPKNLKTKQSK